jgi:hypothetical protein
MTCGPVFYTGIIGDLIPVPDWYESFFKKYPIPVTCQGMRKGAKKV